MSQFEIQENKVVGVESVKKTDSVDFPPEPENSISVREAEPTHAAYVRYLSYESGEFQQGELRLTSEPIPSNAMAVSSCVYLLTPDQEDRLHEGERPRKLQNECNQDGRVAYAIVAESDALENDVEVETIIEWLSTFAEDWLNVEEYDFYYSGNRSIHLHTDTFISPSAIDDLKRLAEEFNQVHDADLDTGIYKENGQFRLVGAEHRDTGFYKVPISSDDSRGDCIRSAQTPVDTNLPFEIPPPSHHDESNLARLESQYESSPLPLSHYRPGFAGISPLPPEIGGVVRRGVYKGETTGSVESDLKRSECARPFSPYKKTGGEDGRSVIVMEQVGGLRQERRSRDIHVPAYIEYAIGGGDGSFTRSNSKSVVQLSQRDYRKWDYEEGDAVVIIGGNSGSSRIFPVEEGTKGLVATALKSKGREKAFEILSNRGFDVGDSGYHPSQYHSQRGNEQESKAAKIKRGIEEGTHERSYGNVLSATCRLLRIEGWDAAFGWCQDIYGRDFDAEETHEKLKSMVEAYDDYSHVDLPEEPEPEIMTDGGTPMSKTDSQDKLERIRQAKNEEQSKSESPKMLECPLCGQPMLSEGALRNHSTQCLDEDHRGYALDEDLEPVPKWQDEEELYKEYKEREKTLEELEEKWGVSRGTIHYWLKQYGIERRRYLATRVERATFYTDTNGYEQASSHISSSGKVARVRVHQLLACIENDPAEVFAPGKEVHHRNAVRWDNRHENIELLARDEHQRAHQVNEWADEDGFPVLVTRSWETEEEYHRMWGPGPRKPVSDEDESIYDPGDVWGPGALSKEA